MLRNESVTGEPIDALPGGEAFDGKIAAKPAEFQNLLAKVQAGSQDAAWTLLQSYGPHVKRVIRRKLNASLRSKFDSMDFEQLVWMSFFRERSQIVDFQRPEQLIAFLATVAGNKVIDETRKRLATQKHNICREHPLTEATTDHARLASPTPSQFAIAKEAWDRLLDAQPEHYRQIVQLKYAGHSNREIAKALDLHEKTVGRVLEKLLAVTR